MENLYRIAQIITGADELAGVQKHVIHLQKGSKFEHKIYTHPSPIYEAFLKEQGCNYEVFYSKSDLFARLKEFSPTHIHAHLGKALRLGALWKFKHKNVFFCYTQHILTPASEQSFFLLRPIKKFIQKLAYQQLNKYIAVSQAVADVANKRKDSDKIQVILNGSDFPDRDIEKNLPRVFESPINILGVSRLEPEKRPYDFIEFAKELNNPLFEINIYGGGRSFDELNEKAKNLDSKTKINFHGYTTKIHEAYIDAHIFLHFGIDEACPLALIEAQSWGLPILTYGVGGNKELLNKETGFLFPIASIKEMVETVIHLTKSNEEYKQYSSAAILWSKNFSKQSMLKNTDLVYLNRK